jgi:uracil-DNA glycosylase family 4
MSCEDCPYGGASISGSGPKPAALCIIGEAPGRSEVISGTPFVGASGQLLDATLKEHGIDRKDVYATNVVMCRPPVDKDGKDTAPNKAAIKACSQRLRNEVKEVNPKIILALGATAANRVLGTEAKISDIVGVIERSPDLGVHVIPTYHPASVLHGAQGYFDNIYDSVKRAAGFAQGHVELPKPYNPMWALVSEDEFQDQAFHWIKAQPPALACDTETHGPNDQPRQTDDVWDMVQFSDGKMNIAVRVTPRVIQILEVMLQKLRNTYWIFHNCTFDLQVFMANGLPKPEKILDTFVLGLGLTEKMEQAGLKYLSRVWLNAPYYERDLPPKIFTHGPQNYAEWLAEAKYGCWDTYNTYHLARILPPVVKREGTLGLCKNLLLPAQIAFADVEFDGTLVDLEYAQALEKEWLPIIEKAEGEMQVWAESLGFPASEEMQESMARNQLKGELCPECVQPYFNLENGGPALPELGDRKTWRMTLAETEFGDPGCKKCMKRRFILVPDYRMNVRSYLHLQHLAFDILRMPAPESKRSCDDNFLKYNESSEFTRKLRNIREKDHILRNYIRGIADDVWNDGRIHPDFLVAGTVTGRLSIHNPPMQTIPKWGVSPEMAKLVRRLIVATPGYALIDVDYSNLELFIAHHYSKDDNLLKALTEYNFHTYTASGIFGRPYDWFLQPENEQEAGWLRFNSKFVTFGIAYGRQAWSLSQGELKELCHGDEREAQKYVDRFWDTYPGYKRVFDEWQYQALEHGVLTTPMGRKRRWNLITPQMVNSIKNQAVNFPIQSLASDTCLSALIRLSKILPAQGLGRVLFTVHDSLVFEIKQERVHEAVKIIEREMLSPPYETDTPFKVDIEVGPNLADVKSYDPNLDYEALFAA